MCDVRNKLTELTGNHNSTAGLIYRGAPLADDVSLDALSQANGDASGPNEWDEGREPPRVIVFDRDQQQESQGKKTPFHFFRTSDGRTLTIDERKDPRVSVWKTFASGLEDDHDPIGQTVTRHRAMAAELEGWLKRGHYDEGAAGVDETKGADQYGVGMMMAHEDGS